MRLITIPVSHYCERARWALDRSGASYTEEQHLQIFHRRPVRKAGGGHTVPVLMTGDGALADSAEIVAYADALAPADQRLYPDGVDRAEVEEVEQSFAKAYGVETRRWAYHAYFPHKRLLLRYNSASAPRWERGLLRVSFPLARRFMTRALDLTPAAVERGRQVVEDGFARVAERLADGRRYLLGDRFTAADLTFAALTAPLVMPPEYGVPMPALDELPPELRSQIQRFRDQPAGAFTLRLYAEERRR